MAALVVEFIEAIYHTGIWFWESVTGGIAIIASTTGGFMASSGEVLNVAAGNYVVAGRDGVISRFFGFTGDPYRRNVFGTFGLRMTQTLRQMITDIRNLLRIPIKILAVLLITFGYLLTMIYPFLFWGLITLFILYLMQEYWPLFYNLILFVGIPLLNIGIDIFNFVFWLIIVIYFVISTIWNIFVPFVGFFVFIISDLLGTILGEIFDVLGSTQIMAFFQELDQIINALTQLLMQVLAAFIKIGLVPIQLLVKIIGFIITIIMQFLRIIMDILSWILKFLFPILKPILWTVQVMVYALAWLFGGVQGAKSSRSLLSVGYSAILITAGIEDPLADDSSEPTFIHSSGSDDGEIGYDFYDIINRQMNEILYQDHHASSLHHGYPLEEEKQFIEEEMAKRKFEMSTAASNRVPLATAFSGMNSDFSTTGSVGGMFGETLGKNIQGMKTTPMSKVAQESLERVVYYQTVSNPYSVESMMTAYWKQNPDMVKMPKGADHVDHGYSVEHPQKMATRLKNERAEFLKSKGVPEGFDMQMAGSGGTAGNKWGGHRRLLERNGDAVWNSDNMEHVKVYKEMEREHEKMVKEQHDTYMNHQFTRMSIVDKSIGIFNDVMTKHTEGFLQIDNIKFHMDSAMNHWGYQSISDMYKDFNSKNPNARALMENLGTIGDHWAFRYLAQFDPRADSHPYFHDWSESQKLHRSRKTLDLGTASDSQEKSGDFPIVSAYNCFTHPRHPLCLPDLGLSPLFIIPTISLPSSIFNSDTYVCEPWVTTSCILPCGDRWWNFLQTIRFLISAIPRVNKFLTIYTYVVPSLSWTVDWLFLVPKGAGGTLHEAICAIGHLYDVAICIITLWLVMVLVVPIVKVILVDVIEMYYANAVNNAMIQGQWEDEAANSPLLAQFTAENERLALQREQQRAEDLARRDSMMRRSSGLTRRRTHQIVNNGMRRRRRTTGDSQRTESHIGAPIGALVNEFRNPDTERHDIRTLKQLFKQIRKYLLDHYHIHDDDVEEISPGHEEHIMEMARNSNSIHGLNEIDY